MEFAFTQIFGTKQRDMLRQKAMGLVMMLLLVVAIVATVAANSIVNLFPMAWLVSLVIGAVRDGDDARAAVQVRAQPHVQAQGRRFPERCSPGVSIEVLTLVFPVLPTDLARLQHLRRRSSAFSS